MSSGTIVPWTSPGGTPCCCDACGTALIDYLWQTSNVVNYQRIFISQQQYEDIKVRGLRWTTNSFVLGEQQFWGGQIVSQSPPITTHIKTMTFPVVTFASAGLRSENCIGFLDINARTLIGITAYNGEGEENFYGAYSPLVRAVVQPAGQGLSGIDAPLAQPALYIFGAISEIWFSGTPYGVWQINASGTSIGTVLGQPLFAFYDTNLPATTLNTTATIQIP